MIPAPVLVVFLVIKFDLYINIWEQNNNNNNKNVQKIYDFFAPIE